jgi:hypothetical protein
VRQHERACTVGAFMRAVFNGVLASSADQRMRDAIAKLNAVTDEVRQRHEIHPARTIEEALHQIAEGD